MKKTNTVRAFLVMGLMAWGTSSFAHDDDEVCDVNYWKTSAVEEVKKLDRDRMNQRCNWGDSDSRRVLHVAFRHAPASVLMEVLKIEGLYLDSTASDRSTLLMFTLLNKRGREVAKFLLMEKEPDINAQNVRGLSALMIAAKKGFEEIIELLIDKEVDLDARNYDHRRSALMRAAYWGKKGAARLLLEAGANVHFVDSRGSTALDYAKKYKRREIAKLLKRYGAK